MRSTLSTSIRKLKDKITRKNIIEEDEDEEDTRCMQVFQSDNHEEFTTAQQIFPYFQIFWTGLEITESEDEFKDIEELIDEHKFLNVQKVEQIHLLLQKLSSDLIYDNIIILVTLQTKHLLELLLGELTSNPRHLAKVKQIIVYSLINFSKSEYSNTVKDLGRMKKTHNKLIHSIVDDKRSLIENLGQLINQLKREQQDKQITQFSNPNLTLQPQPSMFETINDFKYSLHEQSSAMSMMSYQDLGTSTGQSSQKDPTSQSSSESEKSKSMFTYDSQRMESISGISDIPSDFKSEYENSVLESFGAVMNDKQLQNLYSLKFLDVIETDTFEDKAFGCILGAFLGDSCGSYHEFKNQVLTEEEMEECMEMNGGGPWKVGPGQVTDDSEMAMCLMHGLILGTNKTTTLKEAGELDINAVAFMYQHWLLSQPFDIGKTTSSSLAPLKYAQKARAAYENVQRISQKSQSNGSLMRITPMVVYLASVSAAVNDTMFRTAIEKEINLTHCNRLVIEAISLYGVAVKSLLNSEGTTPIKDKAQVAFSLAKELAGQDGFNYVEPVSKESCYGWLMNAYNLFTNSEAKQNMNNKTKAKRAKKKDERKSQFSEKLVNTRKLQGWIQRAFILSFYYLLESTNYESVDTDWSQVYYTAIKETIQEGGDTDTNACIVGGMMGALVGIHNIPKHQLDKLMTFNCRNDGRRRPEFLSVQKYAVKNIFELIKIRPGLSVNVFEGDETYELEQIIRKDLDPKFELEQINVMKTLFCNGEIMQRINNTLLDSSSLMTQNASPFEQMKELVEMLAKGFRSEAAEIIAQLKQLEQFCKHQQGSPSFSPFIINLHRHLTNNFLTFNDEAKFEEYCKNIKIDTEKKIAYLKQDIETDWQAVPYKCNQILSSTFWMQLRLQDLFWYDDKTDKNAESISNLASWYKLISTMVTQLQSLEEHDQSLVTTGLKYVYRGLNLNVADLKKLVAMVDSQEDENKRKLQIEGFLIAYIDYDLANEELNKNFNEKIILRIQVQKKVGSFIPLYNEFSDSQDLRKVLFHNGIFTVNQYHYMKNSQIHTFDLYHHKNQKPEGEEDEEPKVEEFKQTSPEDFEHASEDMIRLNTNSITNSIYSIGSFNNSAQSSNASTRTNSQAVIKSTEHQDAQARKEKLIEEKNQQQEQARFEQAQEKSMAERMAPRETIIQNSEPEEEKPKPVIIVKKEVDAKTMADMLDEMV